MVWRPSYNAGLGIPDIQPATVDDTARYPIGTIVKAYDETQGEGEFIYLPGVASCAPGDMVEYDLTPGAQAVVRGTNATSSNSGRPVAFAMGAIVATKFGWYQISGCAIVSTVAGTVAGNMMATATAGSVGNTADAGDQVLSARILTAVGTPSANKSYAMIQRPFKQGQIT